ncbi:NTP/NDP exchange transporter [Fodinibius sediminis]|uniref:ADP,ATP carrier protein n=1 Tax=Fodinibius sediminis TaxID=1214077 RepID=A0A521C987_9BACT|nr:Npt1/Npt2 family nucleotide transporter [Fodinibius sediminis]SMO56052.1 ATP:ADP antiporter, AAA family [Fodinibius sediminis]
MKKTSLSGRIRKDFFDIRRHEWPTALLMSTFFFMVIATFWILKPMKRGLLVGYYQSAPLQLLGTTFSGAEVEQLAKVLNMIVVYGVVVLFTVLARKFSRQNMNLILCLLFSGLFVLFANLLQAPTAGTSWSFYILGDMFNSALLTFFWAFSNDIFTSDQAKRTYGIVGLGGIIGGIVGSTVVAGFVGEWGRSTLLYLCLVPMAAMIVIGYIVDAREEETNGDEDDGCGGEKKCNAVFEGARLVFNSRYLLAIVGLIGLYEVVSNIVDFQLSATIASQVAGDLNKDVYFGYVGQVTSLVSLLVQLLLTSFIMKRYGVGIALLFLPVAITLGTIGFLFIPSLLFATIMSASDNSLNYSINQSAKEALYTPTSKHVKYKAKAFIDMFVQRSAKVLAVALNLTVAAFVGISNVRWLSVVSLVILVFWILIVRYAGLEFKERASSEEITVG